MFADINPIYDMARFLHTAVERKLKTENVLLKLASPSSWQENFFEPGASGSATETAPTVQTSVLRWTERISSLPGLSL